MNVLSRRVSKSMLVAAGFFVLPVCFAQGTTGGQSQTPPTQPQGGAQQPGGGTQGRQPTQPSPEPQRFFIAGSVKLDSGTPPPAPVVIERDCAGIVRQETYTDSSGNFSFLVGADSSVLADASVSGAPLTRPVAGAPEPRGTSERQLAGCEIRARLAGYLSDSIQLGLRRSLDDPGIGVIYLHPAQKTDSSTFSMSTALAPKDAKKAYEKGLDSMKKQKWVDAVRELNQAVSAYPGYAVAWYELGRVYERQKAVGDANRAYAEAIAKDPKFAAPYGPLAALALAEKKWDTAAIHASNMIKLNPYEGPDIYFISAVANYNLHNAEIAERHAREAASLDSRHNNPRIHYLLGVILAQKHEYTPAAEHLRTFLKFSADGAEAGAAKRLLSDVEEAAGGQVR